MDMLPSEQQLVSENQIITPLVNALDGVTPKPQGNEPSLNKNPSLEESLDQLFPEQQYEERNLQRAKQILGNTVNKLTQEELKVAMIEIKFLAETWVDDFEREIFDGLTLSELLHENGGL